MSRLVNQTLINLSINNNQGKFISVIKVACRILLQKISNKANTINHWFWHNSLTYPKIVPRWPEDDPEEPSRHHPRNLTDVPRETGPAVTSCHRVWSRTTMSVSCCHCRAGSRMTCTAEYPGWCTGGRHVMSPPTHTLTVCNAPSDWLTD